MGSTGFRNPAVRLSRNRAEKQRVTSAALSDGDEIRLRKQKLTFRIEPPIAPTETLTTNAEN